MNSPRSVHGFDDLTASVFLFQPARADQPSAAYSVSHRDHYVLRHSDTVARISLSVERNANGEHNQEAHKAGKPATNLSARFGSA